MKNKLLLFLILIIAGASPHLTFANGGDQRVVENKYFINLSRAPFTPRVGVKTSFLASFVDISKNKLIAEDLMVRVRIGQQGGVAKGHPLFEQDNIIVHGGVLELPYTFMEPGFHEIFFDFSFASDPKKIYEVPDFLIDVQKPEAPQQSNLLLLLGGVVGFILGFFVRPVISRSLQSRL